MDGDSAQVQFSNAQGIVADNLGNLYIADINNSAIRKITLPHHVTTIIGQNAPHPTPDFFTIQSIAEDTLGNLYTIDGDWIHKLAPTSSSILAGSDTVSYRDSVGSFARFHAIANMAFDPSGNIILPDYDLSNVFHLRKVTPGGVVTTLSLVDNTGISDNGTSGSHYNYCIAIDHTGIIYYVANGICLIKKVDLQGNVTVLAGAGDIGLVDGKGRAAKFFDILGMTCDAAGNLWVSDGDNHAIRKVTPDGTVTTIVGTGVAGYVDGDSTIAQFKFPTGITVDSHGVIYVVDNGNNRVRKIEYK